MEEFIARGNIKRFKAQLRASTDEHQKAVLRDLLHAEEQRLESILQTKDARQGPLRESTYGHSGEGGSKGKLPLKSNI